MNLQEIASASALIKKELAPLTEKLGQGAEYTFGLFVKQVYVNAITSLLLIPVGIFFALVAKKLCKKKTDSYDEFLIWLSIAGCIILAFCLILLPISGLIETLINPEYQAIKLIINTFKTAN